MKAEAAVPPDPAAEEVEVPVPATPTGVMIGLQTLYSSLLGTEIRNIYTCEAQTLVLVLAVPCVGPICVELQL